MRGSLLRATPVALLAGALLAPQGWAADTIETFDLGLSNAEAYAGHCGHEQASSSEVLLGYGLAERLSAYVVGAVDGDLPFGPAQSHFALGGFGTPVDTDHFDLDVLVNLTLEEPGPARYSFEPLVELNFDSQADGTGWGLYSRVAMPVSRHNAPTGPATRLATILNPGAYLTLDGRHQILVEWNVTFHHSPEAAPVTETGPVALGYNVVVAEGIELITQVHRHFGSSRGAGLSVGIIAGLPGRR